MQRFLGGSIAALLTANAFAVTVLLDDDGPDGRLRRPAATEEGLAPVPDAPTVTLITSRDGRTFAADPNTPEGRRAIEQAHRDGSTVRDLTIPSRNPSTKPGGTIAIPTPLTEDGLFDLRKLISGGSGLLELDDDQLDDLLDDPVGTVTSLVQSTPSTVTSLLEDTKTTVSSVLEDTKTTVSSVVKAAPTTVTSLVDDTKTTVSSVVGGTKTTVTSIVSQLPVTTAPPATSGPTTTGLLGGVTTVVSLLQGSPSTTVAPAATTTTAPPSDPICTLLVNC